jgi:hypothetical protein
MTAYTAGIIGLVVAATWALVGCGIFDGDSNDGNGQDGLNPALHRAFYWHESNPSQWGPNEGKPIGFVLLPTWVKPDELLVYTAAKLAGEVVSGVYALQIDPATNAYESYRAYAYPRSLWSMSYDYDQHRVVAVDVDSTGTSTSAVKLKLEGGSAVIERTIAESAWNPWCIVVRHDSYVIFGTKPGTSIRGFYQMSKTDAAGDSLLWAGTLHPWVARAASVTSSGDSLYFPVVEGNAANAVSRILMINLTGPETDPLVIAEERGIVTCISPHPAIAGVLLVGIREYDSIGATIREDHIHVLDLEAGTDRHLDVATDPFGRHPRNELPGWNPDGNAIAFPAWTSERFVDSPSELWIHRAPIP